MIVGIITTRNYIVKGRVSMIAQVSDLSQREQRGEIKTSSKAGVQKRLLQVWVP